MQSYGGGVRHLSVDTIEPIARRAVLLDVAGLLKVTRSKPDAGDHTGTSGCHAMRTFSPAMLC